MRLALVGAWAAAALLAACAHPWNVVGIAPGSPKAEVIASAGQPVRTYPRPEGGERLQYTLQPLGQYAFVVDLDAAGRVVGASQALTEANFNRIVPGQWTVQDVEYAFGPPARVDRVASWNGPVYTYRWKSTDSDMYYWVYFTPAGVVGRAHQGMEMINAPNDRAR